MGGDFIWEQLHMMLAGSWWLRVACRLCTYMYLFHVLLFADMERRKEKKRKEKQILHPVSKSSGQTIHRHGPCKQKNLPEIVLQYHFAALLLAVLGGVRLLLEGAFALDSQFGSHDRCVLGNR
jgi:hypothetical protein